MCVYRDKREERRAFWLAVDAEPRLASRSPWQPGSDDVILQAEAERGRQLEKGERKSVAKVEKVLFFRAFWCQNRHVMDSKPNPTTARLLYFTFHAGATAVNNSGLNCCLLKNKSASMTMVSKLKWQCWWLSHIHLNRIKCGVFVFFPPGSSFVCVCCRLISWRCWNEARWKGYVLFRVLQLTSR